jgi:hypothetical protein
MAGKRRLRIAVGIAAGTLVVLAAQAAQAVCSATPVGGCVPVEPFGKMVFRMRNTGVLTQNRLVWRAAIIPQQLPAAVGTGTDDYELCVYDNGTLIVDSLLPAAGGGTWTVIGDTVNYAAASPFPPDGVRRWKWYNGSGGGKFVLRALNVNLYATLGPPVLPVTGPLEAQLVNNVTGLCLGGPFTTINNPGPPTARASFP